MKISFGKHKGEDLCDIPIDYLKWLESQVWLDQNFRKDVQFEIDRREGDRPGQGKVIRETVDTLTLRQNDFIHEFTDDEKDELRAALVSQSICPVFYTFNKKLLSTKMLLKLSGLNK